MCTKVLILAIGGERLKTEGKNVDRKLEGLNADNKSLLTVYHFKEDER